MSLAKTTNTIPAPATVGRRLAGRLLVFAAAASAVGTTAGVAASGADLNDPSSPDAELIALCERFDTIEREHYVEFVALSPIDETRADAVMARMAEQQEPLIDLIAELPPTTLAGAKAVAASIEQWSHGDYARGDSMDDVLARTLIRGLAGRALA